MFLIIAFTFAAIFLAIFTYVYSENRRNAEGNYAVVNPYRKFAPLAVILPVIAIIVESITIVPAGYIGVQQTLGSVNMETLGEGLHFVNPISHVRDVDVRVVKAQLEKANAGTKDLQVVHTDIVVNYRIDGTKAAHIYKEFGLDLQDKILIPAINESFKAVTAHYNSEELITKRDEVSSAIAQELQNKVLPYGLSISTISMVNFGFSAEYQQAIEQKVISTQATLHQALYVYLRAPSILLLTDNVACHLTMARHIAQQRCQQFQLVVFVATAIDTPHLLYYILGCEHFWKIY